MQSITETRDWILIATHFLHVLWVKCTVFSNRVWRATKNSGNTCNAWGCGLWDLPGQWLEKWYPIQGSEIWLNSFSICIYFRKLFTVLDFFMFFQRSLHQLLFLICAPLLCPSIPSPNLILPVPLFFFTHLYHLHSVLYCWNSQPHRGPLLASCFLWSLQVKHTYLKIQS